MADISVFQRVEKKYFMNKKQKELFLSLTKPYMSEDAYGNSKILNIYYDTCNFDLIRHSLSKPDYKEKLRHRSYGTPDKDSKVFVEIKKKFNGIVYKRREAMSLCEAENLLLTGKVHAHETQILREIEYFISFYKPEPMIFIAYDRVAYAGRQNKDLRMTIDSNIRYRLDDLDLSHGDSGTTFTSPDTYLLEIKVPGAFPLWMSKALSEYAIYPISFSKYGAIFTGLQNELIKREPVSETSYCRNQYMEGGQAYV